MARDIICLSHLRWDFVYQRPNHLMARAARDRRVFYVEEPVFEDAAAAEAGSLPRLRSRSAERVQVVTPVLPTGLEPEQATAALAAVMDSLMTDEAIERPVLWYYTPMALPWTRHVAAAARIYDCMDYLAGFQGAPAPLLALEEELLHRSDVVFAGGARLHERLAGRHSRAYAFPSSVDARHFRAARAETPAPAAMDGLRRPRIGYAGVIDERLDLGLIAGVAAARPAWEVVLVGPVAKIDPTSIPTGPNIHALGRVDYAELPAYLGALDVGWMPFAHNEATRYISPTKTPEYLAAGLCVVSTGIRDVVEPYARLELAAIAEDVESTVEAVERGLAADRSAYLGRADAFLATMSWDRTWAAMDAIVRELEEPSRRGPVPVARTGRRPEQLLAGRPAHARVAPTVAGERV